MCGNLPHFAPVARAKPRNGHAVRKRSSRNPRILIVTPEITYLPPGMGNMANKMTAKAGGLADVSASLVSALFELGADVHVALPYYRKMFHMDVGNLVERELLVYKSVLPESRIHLAHDRLFYYRDRVYSGDDQVNPRISLAFQREVINNIIPVVQPDLVHANDWMTGLVPAAARAMGIRSLFTVHNIHTRQLTLPQIEDFGIDAAEFWNELYYTSMPGNYEYTRGCGIPVDLLASGIFAAHHINTVSPAFLDEVVRGEHAFVPPQIRQEIRAKAAAGCAEGILNAPDANNNPSTDDALPFRYDAETHVPGKLAAKRMLQEELGLDRDDRATVLFWPSRLDPVQKGCSLFSDILYDVIHRYWDRDLQVVVVANGAYQGVFRNIADFHGIHNRLAVADFNEPLSRLAYAGSDFVLMPSLFEPCGLPQMVGALYGSLPVVRDTGGLHDCVRTIDPQAGTGNGVVFRDYDAPALSWAIDRAMDFMALPASVRERNIARVMSDAAARFNHAVCAKAYIALYEKMLNRPLVARGSAERAR